VKYLFTHIAEHLYRSLVKKDADKTMRYHAQGYCMEYSGKSEISSDWKSPAK